MLETDTERWEPRAEWNVAVETVQIWTSVNKNMPHPGHEDIIFRE